MQINIIVGIFTCFWKAVVLLEKPQQIKQEYSKIFVYKHWLREGKKNAVKHGWVHWIYVTTKPIIPKHLYLSSALQWTLFLKFCF